MVRKSSSGISSRPKSSAANTSVSRCESMSLPASAAVRPSASTRVLNTSTRVVGTLPAKVDRCGTTLSRTQSFTPSTKPAPVPPGKRSSVGVTHPLNLTAEVRPTGRQVSQPPIKPRLSTAEPSKTALGRKMPSATSTTAASKPPLARQSKVLPKATTTGATETKCNRKK